LFQHIGQEFPPHRQPEGRELNGEESVILVDRAAGEAVGLAERQPTASPRAAQPEVIPKSDGPTQSLAEEVAVERTVLLPRVEADADLALTVENPASDEVAGGGEEVDFGPVGRVARDAVDGPGENPRVSGVERLGPLRFQDGSRGRAHRFSSTDRTYSRARG